MPPESQSSPSVTAVRADTHRGQRKKAGFRGGLLRQMLTWHWISSALALFGMLIFAVTGFTLNHAGQIGAEPVVETVETELPEPVLNELIGFQAEGQKHLPESLVSWLDEAHAIRLGGGQQEWSEYELYVSLPRPGGDAWLSIELPGGAVVYESTERGWVAYFNDLHKGRNTGTAWSWFIDFFALGCVIFCLTGLAVLWLHSRERAAVWPVTGLGVLMPLLLLLLFVH
ncbi:PepSY-associated TM helix domain-containing protein [Hydrocarboniclastica marina]|uniref:Peptidase n=1 Tax=Hydrocarboniclastica marina TaxID=2259620 RepID=A0A4P7XKG5_9ALTE|nr:PepSY-associated TM helix domain-containing protein [Hydrocarboniclastica marina]MAM00200.1 hypothetical protein [Alteromonadaceae bacterium]QCF27538.1 hypothetical protein soil367_17295 [Hydrocarboniclastica marina]